MRMNLGIFSVGMGGIVVLLLCCGGAMLVSWVVSALGLH